RRCRRARTRRWRPCRSPWRRAQRAGPRRARRRPTPSRRRRLPRPEGGAPPTPAAPRPRSASYGGRLQARAGSGGFAQTLELAGGGQVGQRLRLDLAHALGGQAKAAAGLTEGRRVVAVDAVPELDDLALLLGRVAAELRGQLALRPRDLALPLADVHRQADRAPAVGEAALDRLADPKGRVGRELVAPAPVELLAGADQAEDALLDEVEQR